MWKSQLKVILWKSVIIRKRHWFLTLCEALTPVLLFLLIAYGRSKISGLLKKEQIDVTYKEIYPIDYSQSNLPLQDLLVLYSPANEYFDDIIHKIQVKFQMGNDIIKKFDNEEELIRYYSKLSNNTIVAIIFNSQPNSTNFDYTLRHHKQFFKWRTEKLYENEFLDQYNLDKDSDYIWLGLLAIQKALDVSFMEKEMEMRNRTDFNEFNLNMQGFPFPPHESDSGYASLFMHYLPLITLFSFIFVCPAVLKRVVEEKYSGIKELMRMIGVKSWILWFGWFIYSIIPMIISIVLIIIIMKVDIFGVNYPPIEFTDGTVLFVFLTLYAATVTINCFFLSSLFSKPTLATLVGVLIWILSYFVPKYLIDDNSGVVTFSTNLLLMLLPNMALHFGFGAISQYELRKTGLQWYNWNIPGGSGANELSMLNVCSMLIFDCIFYLILALYIDAINPGKFGVPKSYFFPFKWLISIFKINNNIDSTTEENLSLQNIEKGNLPKAIELRKLTKNYQKKRVVDNLSMEIYKDQITVLLGHNGAGKSTTMGMITGMIKKTRGEIIMFEKSANYRQEVIKSIGLCPQHNLFFPDLTVAEHLKFFAMLKGRSASQAEEELENLTVQLHLEEKKNDLAHTLSGGMKRKLCLGMAVIGGSKVLILDEPSSGMDPQSRRDMWDLLLKWRNQRTILITTHFMEEADALGDWIAIMNEGKLQCFGTPMHLKKIYNTGSNLMLLIENRENLDEIVAEIERELRVNVVDVKLKGINGNEVQFAIPSGNYVRMFEHLERNKAKFFIENISFNNTTLEDVFLKSKVNNNEEDTNEDAKSLSEFDGIKENDYTHDATSNFILTLKALIFKRFRFIYRKPASYVIPFVIALGFLLLCIFLGQNSTDYSTSGGPNLEISLRSYGKTRVYFNGRENSSEIARIAQFYKELVQNDKSYFYSAPNVSNAIINEGKVNLPYYKRHMIAAAEISIKSHQQQQQQQIHATALYNNLAIHSAPISLNLISQSVLRHVLGPQYSIRTSVHPLETVNSKYSPDELSETQIGLLWLIIMPLGLLFFLGTFIFFPYMEISTNFTQLQFMSGVPPLLYWLITFLCDLIVFAAFTGIFALVLVIWTPFRGIDEFSTLCFILLFYAMQGLPYSYIFARKKSFSGAYAFFIIFGIMMGVLSAITVLALEESQDESYIEKAHYLRTFFYVFFPQFGLTYNGVLYARKAVLNYNFQHMDKLRLIYYCSKTMPNGCCDGAGTKCDDEKSYMRILTPHSHFMLIGTVVFLLFNVFLDSYWRKKLTNVVCYFVRNFRNRNNDNISKKLPNNAQLNTLRVDHLKKSYSGKRVVNNLSLDLKKGECMGILGVNGAGKTTTFRMLTREEVKDTGNIKISNINIDDNKYLKKLGYCPQNDALNYSLTGRDILKTMAMLRGFKDDEVVENFLDLFELTQYADIPCEQYSGGNKRKLSFAIAVMGFPDFILLDEPTSGVDPLSRRKFWTLIKKIKKLKNNSFILTSHSMAECEAVCNDLKIMKQGTIKKEGTISKLKNEIAGFNIYLKLRNSAKNVDEPDGFSSTLTQTTKTRLNQLKDTLKAHYPEGEIRDEHSGLLHFYIKTKEKKWAELFQMFDTLKETTYKDLIEEYAIGEASLEDVFLAVAAKSEEEEEKCV